MWAGGVPTGARPHPRPPPRGEGEGREGLPHPSPLRRGEEGGESQRWNRYASVFGWPGSLTYSFRQRADEGREVGGGDGTGAEDAGRAAGEVEHGGVATAGRRAGVDEDRVARG